MAILGERWTLVILREAFNRRRRFEDIQRDLGIARNVLADRLQTLVGEGILERRPYQERPRRFGAPAHAEGPRPLSRAHRADAVGQPYPAGDAGPHVELVHEPCGHVMTPALVCDDCGQAVDPRDVRPGLAAA